jgi:integrase/recombinase XerD
MNGIWIGSSATRLKVERSDRIRGSEVGLQEAEHVASSSCPTLKGRRISQHTLRQRMAMHLLQSEAYITVIAIWLGHEETKTTHPNVESKLAIKEQSLFRIEEMPNHLLSVRTSA